MHVCEWMYYVGKGTFWVSAWACCIFLRWKEGRSHKRRVYLQSCRRQDMPTILHDTPPFKLSELRIVFLIYVFPKLHPVLFDLLPLSEVCHVTGEYCYVVGLQIYLIHTESDLTKALNPFAALKQVDKSIGLLHASRICIFWGGFNSHVFFTSLFYVTIAW